MGRHKEYRTLHSLQAQYEKTIYNKKTFRVYSQALSVMVDYFNGRTRRPEDVFRYEIPTLQEYLRKNRGLSEPTIIHYMRVGSAFYSWMDMYEYVPPNYNPFRPFACFPWDKEQRIKKASDD